jgi:hypothetical protein
VLYFAVIFTVGLTSDRHHRPQGPTMASSRGIHVSWDSMGSKFLASRGRGRTYGA